MDYRQIWKELKVRILGNKRPASVPRYRRYIAGVGSKNTPHRDDLFRQAVEIKSEYAISYTDSFAAALAMQEPRC